MESSSAAPITLEASLQWLLSPMGLWEQLGQDFLDYVRNGQVSPQLSEQLRDNQRCRKAMEVVVKAKVATLYHTSQPKQLAAEYVNTPQQTEGVIRAAVDALRDVREKCPLNPNEQEQIQRAQSLLNQKQLSLVF